jgi:cobalamin biosynthesis protein CobD/CbiB
MSDDNEKESKITDVIKSGNDEVTHNQDVILGTLIVLIVLIIVFIIMIAGKGVVCPTPTPCRPCPEIPPPKNADEYMRIIYDDYVGKVQGQWGMTLSILIIVSCFFLIWAIERSVRFVLSLQATENRRPHYGRRD